ncbi:MAG: ferritin-like domain-containing protein [Saprospiraceae bacterium]
MKESSNKSTPQKTSATNSDKPKNGLQEMFEDQLKDIYWAEKALTKALPKMINKATSQELIDALTEHLEITEDQVTRCEEVFSTIGKKPEAKKCEAMEGLLKEGTEIMESAEEGSALDAGIICAAQKVEHYEIATYGTLVAWATQLGHHEAAGLLEETLNEEKEADTTLTEVAETCVNADAMSEEEDE